MNHEEQLMDLEENGKKISPILPPEIKNFLIDIDGTVCEDIPNEEPERMETAQVFPEAIEIVNKWFNEGHIITFFTSRTEDHREVTEKWLNDHGFVRCEDQVAWNENIDNPSYLVRPGLVGKLGYYFNREAIQKMTSLLESQGQWRIASNTDFNALFKHASLLKLGTYSPFQLLVGNPAIKEMKALCTWKNQSVYDIYGLQITPYSYYSGFDKLLINDNYVEYFSHFSEANEVYVTHISPEDKIEPLAYGYGPEATKYGFFIRLIKI
jgi:hypothetical protein